MTETWLRIGILIIGLVIILLYYWFVVRAKNHHGEAPIKNPGPFSRKPSVPDFSDVESDDVKITRRIPAEEADKIRAQSAGASTANTNQSSSVNTGSHSQQQSMVDDGETVQVPDQVSDEVDPEPGSSTSSSAVPSPAEESIEHSSAASSEAPKKMETIDLFEQSSSSTATTPEVTPEQISPDAIAAEIESDNVMDQTAAESSVSDGVNDVLETRSMNENNVDAHDNVDSHEQAVAGEIAEWMTDDEPTDGANTVAEPVAEIDPEGVATTMDETVTQAQSQSAPEAVQVKDRVYGRRRGGGLLSLLGLRRGSKATEKAPVASASETEDDATQGKLSYTPAASHEAPKEAKPPRKMVVVALYPQTDGRLFSGREIKKVMNTFSLVLSSKTGYYESLNALSAPGEIETVFSVGHLRGNSRFSRTTINTMETTGLVFFMNIPGPVNAADSVDMMFSIAAKSAKMLDAKVCDQNKRKLTVDQMINIRDEAVSFQQALVDRKLL